jgi:hypothetical protein
MNAYSLKNQMLRNNISNDEERNRRKTPVQEDKSVKSSTNNAPSSFLPKLSSLRTSRRIKPIEN